MINCSVLLLVLISQFAPAKPVHYDLKIENQPVNLSGKKTVDFALTVNGGIPAPKLEFTEGDTAEITVTNGLPTEEVSIHWHGLLFARNGRRGVPDHPAAFPRQVLHL